MLRENSTEDQAVPNPPGVVASRFGGAAVRLEHRARPPSTPKGSCIQSSKVDHELFLAENHGWLKDKNLIPAVDRLSTTLAKLCGGPARCASRGIRGPKHR